MDGPAERADGATAHVLDVLDADGVRAWSAAALETLDAHRAEIDGLNVFPVPDRDTGTNLALTLRAAHDTLAADSGADTARAALTALSVGAALGAQGNSGAIVSQVLRGIAESVPDNAPCDGVALAAGLARGAALARSAVVDPVEGTILTVAAAAARAAAVGAALADVVVAAVRAAVTALQHTPEQLAALASSGVVDAGGRGLVLLLDALAVVVTGRPVAGDEVLAPAPESPACDVESGEYAFEVQYLLEAPEAAIGSLRRALAGLGDSVVVAGTGDGTWRVHAHVNDVGAAIEAGIDRGRPRQVSVVRFADQVASAAPAVPSAVVVLAEHPGIARLFAGEGVHVIDGPDPDPERIAAGLTLPGVVEAVLLPNAESASTLAEAAADIARRRGVRVVVVPTRSPVQGLAAVAVHDRHRRFDDDVVAMAEAAAATRHAEIVIAQQDSLTSVGKCHAGEVLGLIDGDVVQIGHSTVSVAFALLDRLLGVGAELVTLLVGEGLPSNTGALLAEHVRARSPLTEVAAYDGGPADRPLIIGAE
jgi:DAK2 domain fusion protein YloV